MPLSIKTTRVFICPSDLYRYQPVGTQYTSPQVLYWWGVPQTTQGLSYEYMRSRLFGKTMVQIVDTKGSSLTMMVADFDPVHGPMYSGVDRNYLYADGHLE